VRAIADEPPPVFELDCVSFAGRFLDKAPVKKKAYPGFAVDGTVVSMDPEAKKVLVSKVIPGEAAENAGVAVGDQIISINGYNTDGMSLRELFAAYHMFDPANMVETVTVQKKDGTQATHKLKLLTLDACNPEEKSAWLEMYKAWGY
jgi:C-terminal processing protease CtpA/Prc